MESFASRIAPNLDLVEQLAASGLTNEDIADRFNVPERKFNGWVTKYPELTRALRTGRREMILKVENTVYGLAIGAPNVQTIEVKKRRKVVGKEEDGTPIYKLVVDEKVYKKGPNLEAAKYLLENRDSKRWKRNPVVDIDDEEVNDTIQSVKGLMSNPVPVREGVDEEEFE